MASGAKIQKNTTGLPQRNPALLFGKERQGKLHLAFDGSLFNI
jgi:hypothetical protein